MNRIAIIPARGGSKRIPRKNIKLFCGKPVIAYSIEAAFESGVFDEVMVSTDDEEIAEMAKELGASVPFFRSPETSDDYAVIADVIGEVLSCYRSEGKEFDEFCCLLPAAPFITAARIKEAFDKISAGFESVFPVLKFSYPIKRALQLDGRTGKVSMIWPEHLKTRSQDLPLAYHDSGQFYCMRVEAFLKEKKIFTENSGMIELSELEVQDIDTPEDWKMAEWKFRYLQEVKENE